MRRAVAAVLLGVALNLCAAAFDSPSLYLPGVALVLLGIIVPRVLVYPNRAWMLLAEALSFVTTRIVLGIVFFLVVTPIGLLKRLFGWDPLRRRAGSSPSYWRPYSERQRDARHYEKMF